MTAEGWAQVPVRGGRAAGGRTSGARNVQRRQNRRAVVEHQDDGFEVGVVFSWNDNKRFGFVTRPNRQRVFVHFTNIRAQALAPGQNVRYEVRTDARSQKEAAYNLTIV